MLKKLLSKFLPGNKSNADVKFSVGDMVLLLPFRHDLPKFKSKFPLYDTFLGHLVSFIPAGDLVIDVGANVGDTLFTMASGNNKLVYLCIEADEYFSKYLHKNIEILRVNMPNVQVDHINCFIAKDVRATGLSGGDRTKKMIEAKTGEPEVKSKTLSEIYTSLYKNYNLGLIKIDVDGFDYDVINSSIDILRGRDCFLYFECDVHQEHNFEGYVTALKSLSMSGYSNFAVFDNFGAPILTNTGVDNVIEIIRYTMGQNQSKFTRTFFYVDVLAYAPSRIEEVKLVVSTYIANYTN